MKKSGAILSHIGLTAICLVVLIPVILLVLSSFAITDSLGTSDLITTEFTLDNYIRLFKETNYTTWFMNTLQIAVINVICSLLVILLTGWIMSRFDFKGKKFSLMTIMVLSMFPTFLSMTAIYTLFQILGLVGNPLSLIIIYVAGAIPYNTWLVKGYLDGIPKSLDEAAYIDGATKLQSFVKIILPLAKPIMAYCAVSQFLSPWMDYILPSMLLSRDEQKTLAVGLYSLVTTAENSQSALFASGAVLIAVPITIIFLIFQNNLSQGVAAGADK